MKFVYTQSQLRDFLSLAKNVKESPLAASFSELHLLAYLNLSSQQIRGYFSAVVRGGQCRVTI